MNSANTMPARTLIGFNNRQFSVFADELTTFLMNCDEAGLRTIKDITDDLKEITDCVIDSKCNCQSSETLKRHLKLLRELELLLRGAIYEEK